MFDTPHTTAAKRRRLGRLAISTAVGASLVAAPLLTAPAAVADESEGTYLRIATSADIDTLNPFTAVLGSSTGILTLAYERLVEWGAEDNAPVPGAASEWTTSDDGLTWDFTFPEGRSWSDGEPLTANDAEWTLNAIMTEPDLQQASGGLVANIDTAEATSDTNLRVVLKEPQPQNPGNGMMVLPEHVWKDIDDPATYRNDADAVGSGPFTIAKWVEGQSVELKANPNFWRGAPKIDGIRYVYYKNADAQVQGLKAGEVDIVNGLLPAQFESLKGVDGITVNAGSGRRYTSVAINPGAKDATGAPLGDGNPALQDPTLRRAIFMAIDNATLLDKVLQGLGTLGQTEVPPVYPNYFGIDEDRVIPFDIDGANALLDEAGYAMGPDGTRLDKQGQPLNLRLMGRSSNPQHAQISEYMVSWLKEIGISLEVAMYSDNQVNDDSTLGKYDLYFTGWGIGPDPDFQLSINRCSSYPNADGSGNLSENNWCDPAFDELYDQQHAELDPDQRAEYVKEAFATIYDAAVNNVIWYADSLEAYRSDRFTGFETQPADGGVITGQNGYWGLYSATPVEAESTSVGAGGGLPIGVGIGIAVLVVAAGAVAVVLVMRRRKTADDRA